MRIAVDFAPLAARVSRPSSHCHRVVAAASQNDALARIISAEPRWTSKWVEPASAITVDFAATKTVTDRHAEQLAAVAQPRAERVGSGGCL